MSTKSHSAARPERGTAPHRGSEGGRYASDGRSHQAHHEVTRDEGPQPLICDECHQAASRLVESFWGPRLCPACVEAAAEELPEGRRPWWEVPTPPHLAAIGPEGIWRGNELVKVRPRTLEALGRLAEEWELAQVWVHASALESLGLPREIHTPRSGAPFVHPFTEHRGPWVAGRGAGLAPWAYWWRKGGRGFDLNVPAWGTSSWRDCESAPELLARVALFDHATRGVGWKGSGSITSDAFIRGRLRDRLTATEHPEIMPRALEHPAVSYRRPTSGEGRLRYCYAFDLNLAYAAPASSLALPTGPCHHVEWPTFRANTPGVYLVEVEGSTRWVTAPTLERLEAKGVVALEGWEWAASGRHLRGWYEMVRDAREELVHEEGAALAAVKEICRMGLGRLQSKVRTRNLGTDPLYQPYWAWAVIAEARERLLLRAEHLELAPVAVDTDALFFLSNRTRPELLAGELRLRLGEGLGEFKVAGRCLGSEARAVLDTEERAPRVVSRLRELVA